MAVDGNTDLHQAHRQDQTYAQVMPMGLLRRKYGEGQQQKDTAGHADDVDIIRDPTKGEEVCPTSSTHGRRTRADVEPALTVWIHPIRLRAWQATGEGCGDLGAESSLHNCFVVSGRLCAGSNGDDVQPPAAGNLDSRKNGAGHSPSIDVELGIVARHFSRSRPI